MAIAHQLFDSYSIRQVPLSRPFVWLKDGWNDLTHHRGASLAYGWLVATLGALVLAYNRHPLFIMVMIIGFLLVGPVLTAGLCELSRCRDEGDVADFQWPPFHRPAMPRDKIVIGNRQIAGRAKRLASVAADIAGATCYQYGFHRRLSHVEMKRRWVPSNTRAVRCPPCTHPVSMP